MTTPEACARINIDAQLTACGWVVQDRGALNLYAGRGVAVREFPLATGYADYLLFVDQKAAGIIEAKAEGIPLAGVAEQAALYAVGLPANIPHVTLPLPFLYESTGVVTFFRDNRDPEPRSRRLFCFHRPETLAEWLKQPETLRARLRHMPARFPLIKDNLWPAQVEAITNLERSFAADRPRALIQMATGSGKTFTAVNFVYRLIKHGFPTNGANMHLARHPQAAQPPRTRFSGAWFLAVLLCLSLLMPAISAPALAAAAPVIDTNNDLNLPVSTSATIDNTLLHVSEAGISPNALVYTIVSGVTQGTLKLNGTTLSAAETFTQFDIDTGALSYTAPAVIRTDAFTFHVSDGVGGTSPDTVFTIHINKPEPAVYPTSFQATADSAGQITTTWTDVPAADAPDGYLVVCGSWSPATVLDTAYPMDMPCTDGSGRMHVPQGVGSAVWQGLNSETTYTFAIFPYARTEYTPPPGAYSDYFTAGMPPEGSATTGLSYSISGMILDSALGFGLMSILIDAGNGQSVYTGEDGSYTLTGLAPGDYTLTAHSPYYTFAPQTQLVTVSDLNNHVGGINFTGTALPVIRGTVTEGGQPLAGVLISDQTYSATSYGDGTYNIPVANNWSGSLAPHLLNYYFVPDLRRYTNITADQADENFVGTKLSVTTDQFTAAWGEVPGAAGYALDVATDAAFTHYVPGYENKDVGLVQQIRVKGLEPQTHYFYRVRPYDQTQAGENSTPVEVLTDPPFLYFVPIISR